MQVPLAFIDESVIEEISLSLWRSLFDALGWPESLKAKIASLVHPDVLRYLESEAPDSELLEALDVIHTLGTEAGREAIAAAMADQHVSPDALPDGLGEREAALWLFLRQREDVALAEVLV